MSHNLPLIFCYYIKSSEISWTSLEVQWIGIQLPMHMGSIPDLGRPHMPWGH